jgi:prepilin-type N-terminal cleavage/methylation domain-containing protein
VSGRPARRAFTLVELVVTTTLLAVLSIAAVSILADIPSSELSAAQLRLASAIRYAQELAMTRHSVHGVAFDPATNTYTVFENGNASDPAKNPATASDFVVKLGAGSTKGVKLQSASFGAGSTLTFGTDGAPSSGGTAVLAHAAGGTRSVTVAAQTGAVTP